MKWIKYKIKGAENTFYDVELSWSEVNEETAKREAYNGEYIIEDDEKPEPAHEPTTEELLNAMLGVTE